MIRESDFGLFNRDPNRVIFDGFVAVYYCDTSDFGLTINLFEVYPDGMKEPKDVWAQWSTARITAFQAGASKLFADRAGRYEVCKTVQQLEAGAGLLPLQLLRRYPI